MAHTDSPTHLTDPGAAAGPSQAVLFAPVDRIVALATFDIGGDVLDASDLAGRLCAEGLTAGLVDDLSRLWDPAFLAAREPVVEVSFAPSRELVPQSKQRQLVTKATAAARIYPTGVALFRYELCLSSTAGIAGGAAVVSELRHRINEGYADYLRARYAGDGEAADGIQLGAAPEVNLVRTVHKVAANALDPRPFLLLPFGMKYLYVASALPVPEDALIGWLREFACSQGSRLAVRSDLPFEQEDGDQEIAVWDSVVLASWGGREFYVLGRDDNAIDIVIRGFELIETYRLLVRIWIDYLDRTRFDLRGRTFGDRDLANLEDEMLSTSLLRQRVTYSMTELDALDLAARDTFCRQLLADLERRLRLDRLKVLVNDRLEALDKHQSTIANIVNRVYQDATRKQGDKLQTLFAGAVVAALTGLIPALAALAANRHQSRIIVWTVLATFIGWVLIILAVRRLLPVKISFPRTGRLAATNAGLSGHRIRRHLHRRGEGAREDPQRRPRADQSPDR